MKIDPRLEEFKASLPRSPTLEGEELSVAGIGPGAQLLVTDGERTAAYVPAHDSPKRPEELSIVRGRYVEAGWFTEANAVAMTDGEREFIYVPKDDPRRQS